MVRLPVVLDVEPPRDFVQADGRTMRRSGSCNRCGACCVGNPLPDPAKVDGFCALFDRDVDGVGFCSDRSAAYYLAGCIDWPSKPEHIADKPDCSYSFELVE